MDQFHSNARDQENASQPAVSIFPITQATAATFTDLFIGQTFLCFIRTGSKRVVCPVHGELVGEEGDLLIFPPGALVTLENRPRPDANYHAVGVYFDHSLIDPVFTDHAPRHAAPGIQRLRADTHRPLAILDLLKETLARNDLPPALRQHRLLEPLVWLKQCGIQLPAREDDLPWSKVRRLIETDVAYPWRVGEVAQHFAMSEATFRRWLTRSGLGFAQILLNTRLEKGLALLQSTDRRISQIALDCGFKTPSHFSDAFRKRFAIKQKRIRSTVD